MKKVLKRTISIILVFVTLCSFVGIMSIDAATSSTLESYKHLYNGSFEDNADTYKYNNAYSQPLAPTVPYWYTTSYSKKIEFFKDVYPSKHFARTKSVYPNFTDAVSVADGDVAVELNADEESSIYQKINTISGSTYTWGLCHRGRDVTDSMVLIIGPQQANDPAKASKTSNDQFVKITKWLKEQYGVEYPETGCSKRYVVYSKPFSTKGSFVNESKDMDENISFYKTAAINQEWSIWIISSEFCNTSTSNGWTSYGTAANSNLEDILKGENSSLGYDCTYTVPNGQTHTMFAFCSLSSGKWVNNQFQQDPTFGNMLDSINFDLYERMSTSTTYGGVGSIDVVVSGETGDVSSAKSVSSIVLDGTEYDVYTTANEEELEGATFSGAFITKTNADGTTTSYFMPVYTGDLSDVTDEIRHNYFIPVDESNPMYELGWQYMTTFEADTSYVIDLVYAKAPYVMYDTNGGKPYYFPTAVDGDQRFSNNSNIYTDVDSVDSEGNHSEYAVQVGNLVGFGETFYKNVYRDNDDETSIINTDTFYKNYNSTTGENGYYYSHDAVPQDDWNAAFIGWVVAGSNGYLTDDDGNVIVIPGEHKVVYGETGDSGQIAIHYSDKNGNEVTTDSLTLDATNGVTMIAVWKYCNEAQAVTYDDENDTYIETALGGYITESLVAQGDFYREETENINGETRVDYIETYAGQGEKVLFEAIPDTENSYAFKCWYYLDENGEKVVVSTANALLINVEEGESEKYYALFEKRTTYVVFHYSATGSPDDYQYYLDGNGKYYQSVMVGKKCTLPTGGSPTVTKWYTSPTERSSDTYFDFDSMRITDVTHLYASLPYTFNFYNIFRFKEPWQIQSYGTLKLNGRYFNVKTDTDIEDYNVYVLRSNPNGVMPTAAELKSNSKTVKYGKNSNTDKLLYNSTTKTGYSVNRFGFSYDDFYIFNMKDSLWVAYEFKYNGMTYISSVKNRSLYNNITEYFENAENNLYNTYAQEQREEVKAAQTTLLNSMLTMYDLLEASAITSTSTYQKSVEVSGLTYDENLENPYTFTSTTSIRNIEPWGLKYTPTISNAQFSSFADCGMVVLNDSSNHYDISSISVNDIINDSNARMFSKSSKNIVLRANSFDAYYVEELKAMDFNKNVYAVFFVKDSNGNCYYSDIISNVYNEIAAINNNSVSRSIISYSNALNNYMSLVNS